MFLCVETSFHFLFENIMVSGRSLEPLTGITSMTLCVLLMKLFVLHGGGKRGKLSCSKSKFHLVNESSNVFYHEWNFDFLNGGGYESIRCSESAPP